jgi:hypothetical protein
VRSTRRREARPSPRTRRRRSPREACQPHAPRPERPGGAPFRTTSRPRAGSEIGAPQGPDPRRVCHVDDLERIVGMLGLPPPGASQPRVFEGRERFAPGLLRWRPWSVSRETPPRTSAAARAVTPVAAQRGRRSPVRWRQRRGGVRKSRAEARVAWSCGRPREAPVGPPVDPRPRTLGRSRAHRRSSHPNCRTRCNQGVCQRLKAGALRHAGLLISSDAELAAGWRPSYGLPGRRQTPRLANPGLLPSGLRTAEERTMPRADASGGHRPSRVPAGLAGAAASQRQQGRHPRRAAWKQ